MSEVSSREAGQEQGVSLRFERIRANTVNMADQAVHDKEMSLAGNAELNFILANPNSAVAKKMQNDNLYFFFGDVVPPGEVTFLQWKVTGYKQGEFQVKTAHRDLGWRPYCRAVVKG